MALDLRTLGNAQLIPGATATDDASAAATQVDGGQVVQPTPHLSQVVSTATVGTSPTDSVTTSTRPSAAATPNAAPYTNTAPELPNAQGVQAPVSQAAAVVANTTMFNTTPSAPISTAEMFTILQSSASKSYELATSINTIATQAAITAKQKEVTDTVKQIQGERTAAAMTFATGIVSSAAGIGAGYMGARMAKSDGGLTPNKAAVPSITPPGTAGMASQGAAPTVGKPSSIKSGVGDKKNPTPDPVVAPTSAADQAVSKADVEKMMAEKAQSKREAFGAATAQMGQSIAGATSGAGELYNKTAGGNYEADQAKIAVKLDQVQSQIADVTKDSSKSAQDQALEAVKTAQQAVQSYSQRWTEVTNNTANR